LIGYFILQWYIPVIMVFFPYTTALDGDPLDALILTSEPTFPGYAMDVYPVALFDMEDDKGRD